MSNPLISSVVGVTCSNHKLSSIDPNSYDLRFFREIRMSDAWDGKGRPTDGCSYIALFYGRQLVWERWKQQACSMGGPVREEGNPFFVRMYRLSRLYLKVVESAHRHYFNQGTEDEDSDLIFLDDEDRKLLEAHPQFQYIVSKMGISFVPEGARKRIVTSMRHEEGIS